LLSAFVGCLPLLLDTTLDVVDREDVVQKLRMLIVNPSGYWEVVPLQSLADLIEPQRFMKVPLKGLASEVSVGLGL
jgi:hypothetical protein